MGNLKAGYMYVPHKDSNKKIDSNHKINSKK